MIQPIMIPIPHTNFQTHMPMQIQPQMMPNTIPNNIPNRMPMQQQQPPMPPHPMETMRPPMPVPMMPQQQQQQQQQSEPEFPPVQMLHRIAQHIIAQRIQMEQAKNEEDNQSNEVNQSEDDSQQEGQRYNQPEFMMAQRLPIPEEVLSQINRLPNSDVIVTLSGQDHDEQAQEQPEMHQQADGNDNTMNVRIGYGRQLPEDVPLRMLQVQPEAQAVSDEMRPHCKYWILNGSPSDFTTFLFFYRSTSTFCTFRR